MFLENSLKVNQSSVEIIMVNPAMFSNKVAQSGRKRSCNTCMHREMLSQAAADDGMPHTARSHNSTCTISLKNCKHIPTSKDKYNVLLKSEIYS